MRSKSPVPALIQYAMIDPSRSTSWQTVPWPSQTTAATPPHAGLFKCWFACTAQHVVPAVRSTQRTENSAVNAGAGRWPNRRCILARSTCHVHTATSDAHDAAAGQRGQVGRDASATAPASRQAKKGGSNVCAYVWLHDRNRNGTGTGTGNHSGVRVPK